MPSPFPGMDPFIEFQIWDEFHTAFVYDIADALVPRVKPKYVIRRERRVYVESDPDDPHRYVMPDTAVVQQSEGTTIQESVSTATVYTPAAAEVTLPMPVTHREAFLTVRERESLEVVTVIELLSPSNKRPHSDGRAEYLSKRDAVLESTSHLVEVDLLRSGERLPTVEPLPPADYFVLVSRANRRPRAEVYAWRLWESLPTIPIPLQSNDADVPLDLQTLFSARFDRSGYDYSLNYDVRPNPEFSQEDAQRVGEILQQAGRADGNRRNKP